MLESPSDTKPHTSLSFQPAGHREGDDAAGATLSNLRWLWRSTDLALRPVVTSRFQRWTQTYGHMPGYALRKRLLQPHWHRPDPCRHKCGMQTRRKFLVEDLPQFTITRSRAQSHTGEGRRSHLLVCLLGCELSRRMDQG